MIKFTFKNIKIEISEEGLYFIFGVVAVVCMTICLICGVK